MRVSITRAELIVFALGLVTLITLAIAPAWSGSVFGQDLNAANQTPEATQNRLIADGQQSKIEGIVIKRNTDTFTLREADGVETVVVLTDETTVKTVRKGLFRRAKTSGEGYILRGLRLKVEGTGNSVGQLVARNIRFDEEDLRTAQVLESRVVPVTN